jgi:hypothetical protein
MFIGNYDKEKAENIFSFYDEVKKSCDKYGGLGGMLKPVNK